MHSGLSLAERFPMRLRGVAALSGLAAGAIALLTVLAFSNGRSNTPASHDAERYAAFCVDPPTAAKVGTAETVDRVFRVNVPRNVPDIPTQTTDPPERIVQGQTVEFDVATPVEGALAVHGLSDLLVLNANQSGVVRFRALYTGRFPLHFHGADGSHFEIAVLEVSKPAAEK